MITSFFTSPFVSTLIVPCLLLLAFVYVRWRSGSANVLLDRVWRVVAGKRDVVDPSIRRHLQEVHDLEAFCFRHGIKIDQLADARNLVWFANSKRIPMRDFSKAAPWVDVAHPNFVQPPSKRESFGMYLIFAALLWSAYVIVDLGDSRSAMLITNDSGLTFLADSEGVRSLFRSDVSVAGRSLVSSWAVSEQMCQNEQLVLVNTAGFTEGESTAICTAMLDGTLRDQIGRSVKFQRRAAGTLALVFMACGSLLLLHVLRGISARRLLTLTLHPN